MSSIDNNNRDLSIPGFKRKQLKQQQLKPHTYQGRRQPCGSSYYSLPRQGHRHRVKPLTPQPQASNSNSKAACLNVTCLPPASAPCGRAWDQQEPRHHGDRNCCRSIPCIFVSLPATFPSKALLRRNSTRTSSRPYRHCHFILPIRSSLNLQTTAQGL